MYQILLGRGMKALSTTENRLLSFGAGKDSRSNLYFKRKDSGCDGPAACESKGTGQREERRSRPCPSPAGGNGWSRRGLVTDGTGLGVRVVAWPCLS